MKAELYHETKTKSQANGRLFLSLFLLRKSIVSVKSFRISRWDFAPGYQLSITRSPDR